jgi:pilus assembly protein CpaF
MFGRKGTGPGSAETIQRPAAQQPSAPPPEQAVPPPPPPVVAAEPETPELSVAELADIAQAARGESVPEPPPPPAADAGGPKQKARRATDNPAPPTNDRVANILPKVMEDMKDALDLSALAKLDHDAAREEISGAVTAIAKYRKFDLADYERERLVRELCDEVLGYGPLEPLLARDDIADIMITGNTCYIEVAGRVEEYPIRFRDNGHLLNICQRIVSAVGRRVDESSPICDARLPDGSRVNVIVPPLSVDGPSLTIRKFKKEKLTLDKLIAFGSMTPACARVLQIAATCRTNIVISGGTGSGKTTLLNCLTRYIDTSERIVTCEDACELQLQQKHVVRLETRPANTEGKGEATMRELVKNCLRMRPDRIIVGEVRGPEAFDLLQAMNTGHDGSMGTIHSNTPRECLSRLENMVAMGGFNIPTVAVREQSSSAVGLIVQIKRLRDGSRKVTHVTEVLGMEGEVVTLQDLFKLELKGEDAQGRLIATQKATGVRPAFWEQARYFGLEADLLDALEEAGGG